MTTWLRADEAAALLRTSVGNVHVIAHRRGWRRLGAGRWAAYHLDDVLDEARRRAERGLANHNHVSQHDV